MSHAHVHTYDEIRFRLLIAQRETAWAETEWKKQSGVKKYQEKHNKNQSFHFIKYWAELQWAFQGKVISAEITSWLYSW